MDFLTVGPYTIFVTEGGGRESTPVRTGWEARTLEARLTHSYRAEGRVWEFDTLPISVEDLTNLEALIAGGVAVTVAGTAMQGESITATVLITTVVPLYNEGVRQYALHLQVLER